ncbi:MAG: hypothetical protein CMH34_07715 [Microbacterium sp.]|nr:hypothetical protein [Microbacterium sp.]|tara:strand:+ start:554 stop:916 length:363 start_codon:yes stop_codon:yes gene_type:complete
MIIFESMEHCAHERVEVWRWKAVFLEKDKIVVPVAQDPVDRGRHRSNYSEVPLGPQYLHALVLILLSGDPFEYSFAFLDGSGPARRIGCVEENIDRSSMVLQDRCQRLLQLSKSPVSDNN